MRASHVNSPPGRQREAGFTLAEILLSSAMAAVLLTALAHSAMEFGYTIHYLEDKAGIADAQDAVLRRVTRDIREAWWAEMPSSTHLKLADENGEYIEYYLDDGALWMRRPNGDEGLVFPDVSNLEFTSTTAPRHREGTPDAQTSSWYIQPAPASTAFPLTAAEGGFVSLTLVPPVNAADVGGDADEELLVAQMETVTIPVNWVAAAGPDVGDLTVSLYETRGPGKPKTSGSALGSIVVPGESLPAAVDVDADTIWDLPATETALAISVDAALDPGRGYAVVLEASAGASFVLPVHPVTPTSSKNLIATKDASPSSNWVELPLVVPFSVSGGVELTTTESQDMIEMVHVALQQTNRPEQTRSASVLSQTLGESAWLGVVPGEEAP